MTDPIDTFTRVAGCLRFPDPTRFMDDARAMIECSTWVDWRASFLLGLEKAVFTALILVAVAGLVVASRVKAA